MKLITAIASILIIIGALNWGLYGLFKVDLVKRIFGGYNNPISRIIYILIGLSGVYALFYILFA